MRQATEMQYAYTTKRWYAHKHTHMLAHGRFHKLQTSQEVCRWQWSSTYSLFSSNLHQPTENSFSRIQTHTIRRSHDNIDVMRDTRNTAQRAICSVRWMNTPICAKKNNNPKNIMVCIHNKHSYRSAFFIPKWLCRAMDFINGSLHSIPHTARCNHYSNTRIACIVKHMHNEIEYAWASHSTHERQKYTCGWAWRYFACKVSLEQHNGLQLSEV